jgi:excisionase family DNA binding protein
MDQTKLASLYEVAKETGLSVRWLRQQAIAGTIPSVKCGRSWRFNIRRVEEAIDRMATARAEGGAR